MLLPSADKPKPEHEPAPVITNETKASRAAWDYVREENAVNESWVQDSPLCNRSYTEKELGEMHREKYEEILAQLNAEHPENSEKFEK